MTSFIIRDLVAAYMQVRVHIITVSSQTVAIAKIAKCKACADMQLQVQTEVYIFTQSIMTIVW